MKLRLFYLRPQMASWKSIRRTVRYAIVYLLVRMMIFFSGIIPRKSWLRFCGFLGGISYRFARTSRAIAEGNLQLVYGGEKSEDEIRSLTKRVFVMLGRNSGEVIRLHRVSTLSELDGIREITGVEHLEAARASGKGVIVLTAHVGAFEVVGTELAARAMSPRIVVTPLKDARLNRLLWKQRSRQGAVIVARGTETLKLMRNLTSGGCMLILIDQDTRVKSRFVNFFGHPCATPIGATLMAMRTDSIVVPMYVHLRSDFRQEVNCMPPVPFVSTGDEEHDLVVNTQRLTESVEAIVRKHPEQWVWLHERWKTKPGEEIR